MSEKIPIITKVTDMPRSTLESRIAVLSSIVSALKGTESSVKSEAEDIRHQAEIAAWMLCEYTNALTTLYMYEISDDEPEDISGNWRDELERLNK